MRRGAAAAAAAARALARPLTRRQAIAAGEYIEALGQVFHKGCFKCSLCAQPLTGSFSSEDGKRTCFACMQSTAEPCARCGKSTMSDDPVAQLKMVYLGDRVFHPECFKCEACDASLGGSAFQKNNMVLCKPCSVK